MVYAVNDLYPCIQGEGTNTGVPMVLVRLHGCPVGCVFCDTKETWDLIPANRVNTLAEALGTNPRWTEVEAEEIAATARRWYAGLSWVLLTGGEPAMQDLGELVGAFHRHGFKVALETSGTALGHVGAGVDWVCLSPKLGNPGGRVELEDACRLANEVTWVVGKYEDVRTLDEFIARGWLSPGCAICLQPMSQSPAATGTCMTVCQERGWRLSVQVHKYLELR